MGRAEVRRFCEKFQAKHNPVIEQLLIFEIHSFSLIIIISPLRFTLLLQSIKNHQNMTKNNKNVWVHYWRRDGIRYLLKTALAAGHSVVATGHTAEKVTPNHLRLTYQKLYVSPTFKPNP